MPCAPRRLAGHACWIRLVDDRQPGSILLLIRRLKLKLVQEPLRRPNVLGVEGFLVIQRVNRPLKLVGDEVDPMEVRDSDDDVLPVSAGIPGAQAVLDSLPWMQVGAEVQSGEASGRCMMSGMLWKRRLTAPMPKTAFPSFACVCLVSRSWAQVSHRAGHQGRDAYRKL